MDYFLARYYSSAQARFTSPDEPFADQEEEEPQSWNLFAYVANNPLNQTDPFGLWKKQVHDDVVVWVAEKDDGYEKLAGETGFSVELLMEFFGNRPVIEGVGFSMAGFDEFYRAKLKNFSRLVTPIRADQIPPDRYIIDPGLPGGVGRTSRIARSALGRAFQRVLREMPRQLHHFASNKNKVFSPAMEKIARRFKLDLNGWWNKEVLPHVGRHPYEYHEFFQQGMQRAAKEAGNNTARFLELFEQYVKKPIRENPELLRKSGWQK